VLASLASGDSDLLGIDPYTMAASAILIARD